MRARRLLSVGAAFGALLTLSACPAEGGGSNPPEPLPPIPWEFGTTPIFADEFNGTGSLDPDIWESSSGPNVANSYTFTPRTANVRMENGSLVLQAHQDGFQGFTYTSGMIRSKATYLYGRFEARIRIPSTAGMFPAFWLCCDDAGLAYPEGGEIDIVEHTSHGGGLFDFDYGMAKSNLHTPPGTYSNTSRGRQRRLDMDPTAWHTYRADWAPDEIRTYVDGRLIARYRESDPESAGGGWPFDANRETIWIDLGLGAAAGPVDASKLPQAMETDWVRVYPLVGPA